MNNSKLGKKVEITYGAWAGEKGIIIECLESNNCYRIKLDSGFRLAWAEEEFRILD